MKPRGRRRPRPLHWPRCTLSLHGEGAPPRTHRNQQAGLGATGHWTASRVTLRVWPARLRPTRGWPLVACDCGCPCQTGACVPTRGPAEQGGPGFGLGRWVGRSRSDLVRPKVNVTSEHRGPWEAEGCTWSPQSKVHREPIEGRGAYEKVSPLGAFHSLGRGRRARRDGETEAEQSCHCASRLGGHREVPQMGGLNHQHLPSLVQAAGARAPGPTPVTPFLP